MSEVKRYYYKDKKTGRPVYNLKSPLSEEEAKNYVLITKEEWDELTYVPPVEPHVPTEEETARNEKLARIAFLKSELARTDYQAIKYAEGWINEEEYAEVKAQRQAWRDGINELEAELGGK